MSMLLHPDLGNVSYEMTTVSDDPQQQTAEVIGLMRRYAVEDSRHPAVVADLNRALSGLGGIGGPASNDEVITAIFRHVKGRIRFTQDVNTSAPLQASTSIPIVEALIRPVDMASMCESGDCSRVGDCDDFSMYAAALLLAAGIPCAFVTVKADRADPSRFSHVYVAAYPGGGRRIPLDTSHGQYPGWETQSVYDRAEWPVGGMWGAGDLLGWMIAGLAAWMVWSELGTGAGARRRVWA